MAVVADASALKLDPLVDAAFAGNPAVVEKEFAKATIAGTYPGVIISAAQRQAAWLHKSALAVAEGTPVSALLEGGYPRLHFSRKGAVEIALRNFSAARLVTISMLARPRSTCAAEFARRYNRAARAACDRGAMRSGGANRLQAVASPHRAARGCDSGSARSPPGSRCLIADGQTQRIADALLQRDGVGVFRLGPAARLAGLCAPARPHPAPAPRPGGR